jgi:hypothetical protein
MARNMRKINFSAMKIVFFSFAKTLNLQAFSVLSALFFRFFKNFFKNFGTFQKMPPSE